MLIGHISIQPYIGPIRKGVQKMSHVQVFNALLQKLYYDWLKKLNFPDIN